MSLPRVAVVLAAGQGTRMRSDLPKVLHEAAGRPLLGWVLDTAEAAGCERTVVVVGHGSEQVRERFSERAVEWVVQERQLGTGHALLQVESLLEGPAVLVVLSGDVPLVTPATVERLLAAAEEGFGALAVADLAEPGSLGRVVLAGGRLERIVEARDATEDELGITLVNAGLYALPAPEIFERIRSASTDNEQGELYLTDGVTSAAADGREVRALVLEDPGEARGVNSRGELAAVGALLRDRIVERWMDAGVTVVDPSRVLVELPVTIGRDTVIEPDVSLLGLTAIGERVVVGQGAVLRDASIGDDAVVEPYSVIEGATVGAGASVGPFARLRPGTHLDPRAKVGTFVETKKTRLGEGAKAPHLSYLGDAEIGPGANVGAGTITCNYDGVAKHRTTIGARAFIGSDTMLVAPVEVGEGAVTGAGSVITRDVPDDALAVTRPRQKNVEGWARRRRERDDD